MESVRSTKFLGVHIKDDTDMDYKHHFPCQERTAASSLPATDEESSPPSCPHNFLHRNHIEQPDQQPLSRVWQLHRLGPEVPPESGEDSREYHQNPPPPIYTASIPDTLPWQSHQDIETLPTRLLNLLCG